MTSRSTMRTTVRAAAQAELYFSAFTVLEQWGQGIDPEALPGFAVFTPRENKNRVGAGQYQRLTDLVVLIRREGAATLEDDLDLDAEAAETMVLAAIIGLGVEDCELVSIDTEIPGTGEKRIGSVTLTFRVLQLT